MSPEDSQDIEKLRAYPHQPMADVLQRAFAGAKDRFVLDREMTPELIASRTEIFFRLNTRTAVDCASFAYAFEHPLNEIMDYLRESRLCFNRLLDFGTPIPLNEYSAQQSVALILNDKNYSERLGSLPRERYTHPDVGFDEIFFVLAEFVSLLSRGDVQAVEKRRPYAQDCVAKTSRSIRDGMNGFLNLQLAVATRNQSALDAGLRARQTPFAKAFRNLTIRNFPTGLLDLWGLGLARLALNSGLEVRERSVYLPLELL